MSDTDDVLRELASLPTIASPRVSPDGETIALYYDVTGRNELHLLDPSDGSLNQLSDGEVPRSVRAGFEWDPTGDRIFYHRDDDGDEQHDVWAMSLDGESEPVVETDGQTHLFDVGEDGETLLFGSTRDGQMNLYRHDLPSGETGKLTDYERAAGSGHLSPAGDRIAYSTNETDAYENSDVYVADADGSNPRNLRIGETGAEARPVDWGPKGDRLLVSDNATDLGRSGIVDLAEGVDDATVTWFGGDEFEESPSHFLEDGARFVASRTRGAVTVPVVYDVETSESRELEFPAGVASVADGRLGDDRLLAYRTTSSRRPELVAYDLASDATETVLDAEYGPFAPDDFVEPETVSFASDGVPETPARAVDHDPSEEFEIDGLLFDSGRRPSPLIVNPHGGPRHHDMRRFSYRVQFLLSRGYSVLQVNYRGSTGRGREFVEELYDDWGGAEQGDVATGAEHVLDEYDWLDEDRVVVYGGSYGGYSANWQLVQYPGLYDAGIAWVGVSDLFDMYENTMPHFRTELMVKNLGEPDANEALYRERSPVTHVANLDAPLLIVHGVNDPRVPVSQARILRDALADAGFEEGVDYEYEELGEEGHGSGDIDQKIRSLELLDDFLDRRIGAERTAVASLDD
ncbi:S9 family peptidase [Halorubrum lipolyticum]|uniref:Peptidase S9 prolyl oligopeptidase active site domain protein n=1 Tax=Halorubrum lipolyticum DSM 21995 TaxID=1227482 RepID=M0NH26_9EURY|nr:prolyl oligopeptidase family serine peptidase [Halorubrum lipolyticum]EMA57141.1 peptidase S9 prolyl oligopeptidase active site domain protein [Halorubrum lipolyticum DSM 21995]